MLADRQASMVYSHEQKSDYQIQGGSFGGLLRRRVIRMLRWMRKWTLMVTFPLNPSILDWLSLLTHAGCGVLESINQQGSAVDRLLNTLPTTSLFVPTCILLESSRAVYATVLLPLCHQDIASLSIKHASESADNHVTYPRRSWQAAARPDQHSCCSTVAVLLDLVQSLTCCV
jgi:hypothetical protein